MCIYDDDDDDDDDADNDDADVDDGDDIDGDDGNDIFFSAFIWRGEEKKAKGRGTWRQTVVPSRS